MIFDSRTNKQIHEYKKHQKSVLSIGIEQNKIISISEDNRIISYDMRSNKVIHKLVLDQPVNQPSPKTYPKSCSFAKTGNYCLNQFYVGDIRGGLYLINSDSFKIVKKYENLHQKSVQSVFHTLGAVYTCSADGSLIIHEPNLELRQIHKIQLEKTELPKVLFTLLKKKKL
jgi:WD40 repeat protein